jgi:hypothetical protein
MPTQIRYEDAVGKGKEGDEGVPNATIISYPMNQHEERKCGLRDVVEGVLEGDGLGWDGVGGAGHGMLLDLAGNLHQPVNHYLSYFIDFTQIFIFLIYFLFFMGERWKT